MKESFSVKKEYEISACSTSRISLSCKIRRKENMTKIQYDGIQ